MMAGARLNYLELRAGDLGAVKSFYADALGLTFADYGPSYAAATQAGGAARFTRPPTCTPSTTRRRPVPAWPCGT